MRLFNFARSHFEARRPPPAYFVPDVYTTRNAAYRDWGGTGSTAM